MDNYSAGDLKPVIKHSFKNNVIKGHSQLMFPSFHGLLTLKLESQRNREEEMSHSACQIREKKKTF